MVFLGLKLQENRKKTKRKPKENQKKNKETQRKPKEYSKENKTAAPSALRVGIASPSLVTSN